MRPSYGNQCWVEIMKFMVPEESLNDGDTFLLTGDKWRHRLCLG